ncbi:hypothetical protein LENED_002312 [Lentinula edodes]|uniref:Uncharacterized protein n=1 Tax=Lentinula edodes TaxID=5353 RepID=A0A1Q3E0I8_LENED|nr:hypothetical protein LENED_002312 [Lentinula edodes]
MNGAPVTAFYTLNENTELSMEEEEDVIGEEGEEEDTTDDEDQRDYQETEERRETEGRKPLTKAWYMEIAKRKKSWLKVRSA